MKKILFKTVGWIFFIISFISIYQTDPVESPWKFIIQILVLICINDIFDLYIEDKLSKIKDWFTK